MNNLVSGLVVGCILIFSHIGMGQVYPDLISDVSGEIRKSSEEKCFQNVRIVNGGILAYDPAPRDRHFIGIKCDSFLVDRDSAVIFGSHGTPPFDSPISTNTIGTPKIRTLELGNTFGNGAGSYGGRGYNIFGIEGSVYGSATDFFIQEGSMGTDGETIRVLFGGGYQLWEGRLRGGAGGAISVIGNDVTIKGCLNVNGWSGRDFIACAIPYPGYSGSGGGILIAAKNLTISDTARITANGGEYPIKEKCNQYGIPFHYHEELIGKRDGGGGRIKIFYEQGTISPEAVIEAKGWEDGTVHIEQVKSIEDLMRPKSDINKDDVVDQEDLFLLKKEWHQALTPIPVPVDTPTPTSTPE